MHATRSTFLISVVMCFTSAEKVRVEAYIESQCPDTDDFIQEQLVPTIAALNDYIQLDMVIYGKAHQDSSGTFECQHKTKECQMNQVQLCGIKNSENTKQAVTFVACTQMKDLDSITRCAEESEASSDAVKNCYESGEGLELMREAGKKTDSLKPPLSYVPSVAINGVQSEPARSHLKDAVCAELGEAAEDVCGNK